MEGSGRQPNQPRPDQPQPGQGQAKPGGTAQAQRGKPQGAQPPVQPASPQATKPGAQRSTGAGSRPAPGARAAAPTTEQRLEGVRAWLAEVDRRLGVRTYALGAAFVLSLAASIVALVLALSAKDEGATQAEVDALRDQVEALQQDTSMTAEQDVTGLTERLDELEGRVNSIASDDRTTERELSVVQDDIEDLRREVNDLDSGGGN